MSGMTTTRSIKSGSMEEKQRQRIRKLDKDRRDAKEVRRISVMVWEGCSKPVTHYPCQE